MGDLFLKT